MWRSRVGHYKVILLIQKNGALRGTDNSLRLRNYKTPVEQKFYRGFLFCTCELGVKKYILSMDNTYTVLDCLKLSSILNGEGGTASLVFHDSVINKARLVCYGREITEEDMGGLIQEWLEHNHRSIARKAYNFLFKLPLEEVPLFINDTDMKPFVKWRLEISK